MAAFVVMYVYSMHSSARTPQSPTAVVTDNDDVSNDKQLVVEYCRYQGHPVQLIVDRRDGAVVLRVKAANDDTTLAYGDETLKFLAAEITKFATAQNGAKLGDSGMTLNFSGRYPMWGPYKYHNGKGSTYDCLYFAESASVHGSVIEAQGQAKRPPYDRYVKID